MTSKKVLNQKTQLISPKISDAPELARQMITNPNTNFLSKPRKSIDMNSTYQSTGIKQSPIVNEAVYQRTKSGGGMTPTLKS